MRRKLKINGSYIEYSLIDGNFSASAHIKVGMEESSGQCLEEFLEKYGKVHPVIEKICIVWKRWRLNDMKAGSPRQEKFLDDNNIHERASKYKETCKILEEAGLNPDSDFFYKEKPYEYGTAWLKEELPQEVVEEILSWDTLTGASDSNPIVILK